VRGLVLLLCVGCSGPPRPTGEISDFPAPEKLPEVEGRPALLVGHDGMTKVATADDFTSWRRRELLALFAHYVYGAAPVAPSVTTAVDVQPVAIDGGTYQDLAVTLDGPVLHVGLFLPPGVTKPPVVLGLNKCGTQTLLADAAIRQTTSPVIGACGSAGRGTLPTHLDVPALLAAGIAVATFHDADAAPDDASLESPVAKRFPAEWGTIAVWSWSLSRAVDALVDSGLVDAKRIAVFGHSRRGKAALWAAANDARFAVVLAHQSGLAGAAPCRAEQGETIELNHALFPHWFSGLFVRFAGKEKRLPIEQHELIALLAPRPVLVTDGDDDAWANPPGARADVEAADVAWQLLGDEGLDAKLVWRSRPGGHETTAADWATEIEFLQRHGFGP
jgi:hypothetical protein